VKINRLCRFCGWGGIGVVISTDFMVAMVTKMIAANRCRTRTAIGPFHLKEQCDEVSSNGTVSGWLFCHKCHYFTVLRGE
jgi:hypothetical protein